MTTCKCSGLVKEPAASTAFDEDMYDCVMCGHPIGDHNGKRCKVSVGDSTTLPLFSASTSIAQTGCADPPWAERGGGKSKRGADRHYPLLSTGQIVEVMKVAVPQTMRFLWMWTTSNFIPDAIFVGQSLGFKFTTSRVWVKESVGLGQHVRMRHEPLFLFRRGEAHVPAPPDRPDSVVETVEDGEADDVIREPRRRHSQKPDRVYDEIRKAYPGPHLEIFGIGERKGWEVFGNGVWTK